jgi:hypothetical protein
MKAMVENLENLPIILILPKMDKKWEVKRKLVHNGLPNQCANVKPQMTKCEITYKQNQQC